MALIDLFNNLGRIGPFNFSSIVVNDTGGAPLTAKGNTGACVTPGSGCWSCATSNCNYKNYKKELSFVELGAGSYRLTLDITDASGVITDISVRVPNMPLITSLVEVTKVSMGVWDIKTYDTSGGPAVLASDLFDNTFIDVVYYYSPFITI